MSYQLGNTDNQDKEQTDKFNEWIDVQKRKGYTGLISISDFRGSYTNWYYAEICDERDDMKKVNTNQYQIIYNDNEEVGTDFDFEIIEPNELFYTMDERFKNKKLLIEFLDKSEKIYLNSDMCLVPYTYKKDDSFYLLVINNIVKNIEDYQLKSLNYLNKQHNIYYIIETNKDDRFENVNDLKNYILKTCQKYVNPNMDLLYSVYTKVDNFKKDKAIVRHT